MYDHCVQNEKDKAIARFPGGQNRKSLRRRRRHRAWGMSACRCLNAFHAAGFSVNRVDVIPTRSSCFAAEKTTQHLGHEHGCEYVAAGRFSCHQRLFPARRGRPSSVSCPPRSENTWSRISATFRKPPTTIAKTLRRGNLVVLESTTYPGTTAKSCSRASQPRD